MREKIKETVRNMIIFHGLSDKELDALVEKIDIRNAAAGEIICREGDMGRELYVILSGKVRVLKNDSEGQQHELLELKEKDSFGEMTLIDVQKRSATVQAMEDSTLVALSYSALGEFYFDSMPTYVKIILNIAREFSRRLRHMDEIFVEYFGVGHENISELKNPGNTPNF